MWKVSVKKLIVADITILKKIHWKVKLKYFSVPKNFRLIHSIFRICIFMSFLKTFRIMNFVFFVCVKINVLIRFSLNFLKYACLSMKLCFRRILGYELLLLEWLCKTPRSIMGRNVLGVKLVLGQIIWCDKWLTSILFLIYWFAVLLFHFAS